jgi:hypothetical protein
VEDAEDVETHEAYDDASDEVSFTTAKKLTDFDQGAILYSTDAILYSFNADDY